MTTELFAPGGEDPIYKMGDRITSEIKELFSINLSDNKKLARRLAVEYVEYIKEISLHEGLYDDISGAGIYDYVRWSSSITRAKEENWEYMAGSLKSLGEKHVRGTDRYLKDSTFGNSLINLSKSL